MFESDTELKQVAESLAGSVFSDTVEEFIDSTLKASFVLLVHANIVPHIPDVFICLFASNGLETMFGKRLMVYRRELSGCGPLVRNGGYPQLP